MKRPVVALCCATAVVAAGGSVPIWTGPDGCVAGGSTLWFTLLVASDDMRGASLGVVLANYGWDLGLLAVLGLLAAGAAWFVMLSGRWGPDPVRGASLAPSPPPPPPAGAPSRSVPGRSSVTGA